MIDRIIAQWLIKADNDYKTIENEFSSVEPVTDSICYHAQQGAEKYLKLFLVANGIDPLKTHNITILIRECEKIDSEFSCLVGTDYLSDYAVELRYPDSFYIPVLEESKEAYESAKRVRDFVLERLKRIMNP
jgi:HEPN domain-containing protein